MNQQVDSTIAQVRRIATELRPAILDTLGLIPALEWQVRDFRQRTGIACSFYANVEDTPLDKNQSTAVFRIAQESLTNVVRHAKASRAEVRVFVNHGKMVMTVKDNGVGISEQRGNRSFGLLGMQERALLVGGDINWSRGSRKGTTVTLTVPLGQQS